MRRSEGGATAGFSSNIGPHDTAACSGFPYCGGAGSYLTLRVPRAVVVPMNTETKCGTGVPGLDEILGGGLPRSCLYLVEGNPGVGKTTLAMQFLLEGKRAGEKCLYVTLSETQR